MRSGDRKQLSRIEKVSMDCRITDLDKRLTELTKIVGRLNALVGRLLDETLKQEKVKQLPKWDQNEAKRVFRDAVEPSIIRAE